VPDDRPPPGDDDPRLQTLERARTDAAMLVDDLRAELSAIGESTDASPDDEHDAEGSTVGYERARVSGLLERAERTLTEVSAAVERLRQGRYGTCISCGAVIPPERLAALPTTLRCASCATIEAGPSHSFRAFPGRPERHSDGRRGVQR
jgi:DnaK suppressor protein